MDSGEVRSKMLAAAYVLADRAEQDVTDDTLAFANAAKALAEGAWWAGELKPASGPEDGAERVVRLDRFYAALGALRNRLGDDGYSDAQVGEIDVELRRIAFGVRDSVDLQGADPSFP